MPGSVIPELKPLATNQPPPDSSCMLMPNCWCNSPVPESGFKLLPDWARLQKTHLWTSLIAIPDWGCVMPIPEPKFTPDWGCSNGCGANPIWLLPGWFIPIPEVPNCGSLFVCNWYCSNGCDASPTWLIPILEVLNCSQEHVCDWAWSREPDPPRADGPTLTLPEVKEVLGLMPWPALLLPAIDDDKPMAGFGAAFFSVPVSKETGPEDDWGKKLALLKLKGLN